MRFLVFLIATISTPAGSLTNGAVKLEAVETALAELRIVPENVLQLQGTDNSSDMQVFDADRVRRKRPSQTVPTQEPIDILAEAPDNFTNISVPEAEVNLLTRSLQDAQTAAEIADVTILRLAWLCFACAAVILYCWQFGHHSAKVSKGVPLLRQLGLGAYVIEVSEVQLGNLPTAGELYLSIQAGEDGKEDLTTAVQEVSPGMVVRFFESFTVQVRHGKHGGNLLFTVMDSSLPSEECVARLKLPLQELLRLVRLRRSEFFSFDLELKAWRYHEVKPGGKAGRPCLALRLRDISGMEDEALYESQWNTRSSNSLAYCKLPAAAMIEA